MTRNIFIIGLCLISGLWGCSNEKSRAELQSKIDSLNAEVQANQAFVSTLNQVGTMIDSIDASRQALNTSAVEGTTYKDYADRLASINSYVKSTQAKLDELEHSVNKSHSSNAMYAAQLRKMKKDLQESSDQIAELQNELAQTKAENSNLAFRVDQQSQQLTERLDSLNVREANIRSIQHKLDDLNVANKEAKADLYYQYALAKEEAAARTHFAWKKKKETQRQALELYRMAYELGKMEAQPKIDELEKEVG